MKFKVESLRGFTIIPNDYLRDKRMSLKAKGLLSVMYSLPNDWDFSMNGLCKITNCGITQIRSAIEELEILGYMERKQTKNEKGQFDYIYHVYFKSKGIKRPISLKRLKEAQKREKPHIENLHAVNPIHI